MCKRVLIPGSYDPVTLGHTALIAHAAARYDEVWVVAFVNAAKDYLFTVEERLSFLRHACARFPRVKVAFDGGYVADFVKAHGIELLLKGYRNPADLAYEQEMAAYNLAHSGVETRLVPCAPELCHVSASEVRRRLYAGESPAGLLPDEVVDEVRAAFAAHQKT
ncbi:MAG: adenylyltransferase/cytidyltransferase family protein [Eubacteriales bacterium]